MNLDQGLWRFCGSDKCVLRNVPMVQAHRQLDLSHRPELLTASDGIRPAALTMPTGHKGWSAL